MPAQNRFEQLLGGSPSARTTAQTAQTDAQTAQTAQTEAQTTAQISQTAAHSASLDPPPSDPSSDTLSIASSIPLEPPSYEHAVTNDYGDHSERVAAEIDGEDARFLQGSERNTNRRNHSFDSINSRDSLDSLDSHNSSVRREIQQFEILEPPVSQNSSYSNYIFATTASRATSRIAQSLKSNIFMPVKRMLDPVAQLYENVGRRFDSILMKVGNPLILKRLLYMIMVALLIYLSLVTGIVPSPEGSGPFSGPFYDKRELKKFVRDAIDPQLIRDQLEYVTSMSHMTGTAGDLTLAKYVYDQFVSYGMNPVELNEQSAYLTSPNSSDSAMILRVLGSGGYVAKLQEAQVYDNPTEAQKQPRPFHGLSATGEAEGHIIYANYGTKEDFARLKEAGISVKGAVIFMKYGKMESGLKVLLAQKEDAVGVVMFNERSEDYKMWPEGPDYPSGAVERDSVAAAAIVPGDVLTPGWSTSGSSRKLESGSVENMPKIPSLPVSWDDAVHFLKLLKGHGQKLEDWQSSSPAGMEEWWTGNQDSAKVYIKNEPIIRERHSLWNVLGKIEGIEQSEKAIIIGTQRDSWCYGAVDPMSSTVILLELGRIFSLLSSKLGWTPLRSIYFCSWDGTEQNFIGSTEWVEYNVDELRREGAVYINLDSAVSGQNFKAKGHPLLESALREILSLTVDPSSNSTLGEIRGDTRMETLKPDGNHLPFLTFAGVPSLDLSFGGLPYPRHSCFDTFDWMTQYGDPQFEYHRVLSEIVAMLLIKFADEPLIEFDVQAYGDYMSYYIEDLQRYAEVQRTYTPGFLNFDPLNAAVRALHDSRIEYEKWKASWEINSMDGEAPILAIHRWSWNSRLVNLDKHMLDSRGIPHRPWFKHVLFGPQVWHPTNGDFEWNTFPAIRDRIEAGDWVGSQKLIDSIGSLLTFAGTKLAH